MLSYNRYKNRSDFAGHANYGKCASRDMKYFGYKLMLLSTLNGLPIVYILVPANFDERLAAEAVTDYLGHSQILPIKAF